MTQRIGFIPTMGFLHEGHLSLVREARRKCDRVVVSIFVNPTQFEPHEDFERYPRDLERDRFLLEKEGVDELWIPSIEEIYPEGSSHTPLLKPSPELSQILCGRDRPHHFVGVATVMQRLLQRVQPTDLYMGQKDYQQTRVVQWLLARDFSSVHLHVLPTVRESDGLAMSSRNVYLSSEERAVASRLYVSLQAVKDAFEQGEEDITFLQQRFREVLEHPMVHVLYAEARGVSDLRPLVRLTCSGEGIFLAALRIGKIRLIDNLIL
jgi:pantoate--beta-alanine ligase